MKLKIILIKELFFVGEHRGGGGGGGQLSVYVGGGCPN